MNSYRIEHDSMGEVRVPNDKLWGAQTERSRQNFPIGVGIEIMPQEIIHALALIKKACALANRELVPEQMTEEKCAAISRQPAGRQNTSASKRRRKHVSILQ